MSEDSLPVAPKGRDPNTGKFQKGNTYYLSAKNQGRKKDHYEILRAVTELAYTPEQLIDLIHETVDLARGAGDWKGVAAIIRLVLDYTIGKPVQRTLTATMQADELRAMFFRGEEDGVVIDAVAEDGGDDGVAGGEWEGESGDSDEGDAG